MEKLIKLKNWFKNEGKVVVGLSGGVDSVVLAYIANSILKNNMIAVTGDSHSVPSRDRNYVIDFCKDNNIAHTFIKTDEFSFDEYKTNPENRCYYCKKELFNKLTEFALDNNFNTVIDGTNSSDLGGHRPGYRAIQENSRVKTPYIELEFEKKDVREIAAYLNLEVADKPAAACLASRIPTGHKILKDDLALVDRAENALRDLGFKQVRVRHHGELARIQVDKNELGLAFDIRNQIVTEVKKIGYQFVSLDLKCYGENSE